MPTLTAVETIASFQLSGLGSLLLSHAALLPVAGGAFTGLAVALWRPFSRQSGSRSLMEFSSMGALLCICGTEPGAEEDRRHVCRACGCEVMASDPAMLDRQLSRAEIRSMTRSMRQAAIRASHLELPSSVNSVAELHRYLASPDLKSFRPAGSPEGAAIEQTQIH